MEQRDSLQATVAGELHDINPSITRRPFSSTMSHIAHDVALAIDAARERNGGVGQRRSVPINICQQRVDPVQTPGWDVPTRRAP